MKKRIAVIVAGVIEPYQNGVLTGICEYAKNQNCDVLLFQCFNGGENKEKYDIGEHNILNLVEFEDYDGVILLANTIRFADALDSLLEKIKKTSTPVVTVEYHSEEAYSIISDNLGDMKKIVNHIINKHNCRDIGFVTGFLTNAEATNRFNGYKQALAENGIEYCEDRVFYGQFRTWDGEYAVKQFAASEKGLPEAIVCSNDHMALGAYEALVSMGIKVPEQVKITGFDNIRRAESNKVPITTVHRILDVVGIKAIETIFQLINGEDVEKVQHVASKPIYTSSCGCPEYQVKYNKALSNSGTEPSVTAAHLYTISRMLEDLNTSLNLELLNERLEFWVPRIERTDFFLCLCDNWDYYDAENLEDPNNRYRTEGYSEKMTPQFTYYGGNFLDLPAFDTRKLIPVPFEEDDPTTYFYMFYPLHFRDRCLGYCVYKSNDFHFDNNVMYTSYSVNIINALEIISRENKLKILVNKLNRLSLSDALTGIYNRHGFTSLGQQLLNSITDGDTSMMIVYFDLDGLKHINDTLGHEEGDIAIKALADAIKSCSRETDIVARLGGDEFVVMGPYYTYQEAELFCKKINTYLDNYNSKSGNSFTVSVSSGCYVFSIHDGMELSDYIDIADGKMYKEKYEKKKKVFSK